MKVSCDIVQDLLPLYEEELCSLGSRIAIEKHLEECPECRKQIKGMQTLSELAVPASTENETLEEKEARSSAFRQAEAIAGSLRKIKQRWVKSVVCIVVAIPFCILMGILISNQVRRQGICFTNPDEIIAVYRFANAMERGDYESAVEFMDYEKLYQEIQRLVANYPEEDEVITKGEEYKRIKEEYEKAAAMSTEEFTEIVKQRCLEDMLECKKQNIAFENKGYVQSYFIPENRSWIIDICLLVSKDGKNDRMTFGFLVKEGKLSLVSSRHITEVEWFDTVHDAMDLYYMY